MPIALVALLALGATAPGASAAETKTVPIKSHLSAQTDPLSFRPGCPSYCERTYYNGEGTYSGDLTGRLDFAGYSYRRDDGKLASHEENDRFEGTVAGCGRGTFRYVADGVFDDPGPAQGGVLTGEESVKVTPGTGTSDLTGLTGSLDGIFVVPPDGSLQVDYTGTFRCRTNVSPPQRGPTRLLLGPTRGMRRADAGRPFRIRVRALGGVLRDARVVVRDVRGRRVGRSRRFSLGKRRKRVRVRVARRLEAGRYRISATGRDALGKRVSAVRRVRLSR